ncbi:hypothetical protein KUCAC02_015511 [Chaenocephalus aceratus]|uniref:Uncharacterized protein n=1 Tax=Chaenocephalus aceratus TaxID=36190 RepID=A0ACB9XXQ2_CHAAC|nr:hypothetical protein KUCAC02_015511 [Chaenocephalus aceratus]
MPPIFTISVGCLTAHGGTENTIQQAVEKEERPMPDERRAFVNALVDQNDAARAQPNQSHVPQHRPINSQEPPKKLC